MIEMIKKWKAKRKKDKILKRYSEKQINPNYFSTVNLSGFVNTQPMTAPITGSLPIFHLDYVYGDEKQEDDYVRIIKD